MDRMTDESSKSMLKQGLIMQALSEASLEEVNAMWAGLGYYRRARFLLEGAQYVMQHHSGSFPRTSKELQKIPGNDIASLFSLQSSLRANKSTSTACLFSHTRPPDSFSHFATLWAAC